MVNLHEKRKLWEMLNSQLFFEFYSLFHLILVINRMISVLLVCLEVFADISFEKYNPQLPI